MRVTLISMVYPHPRPGFWPGIERQVGDFSRALKDAGASVSVITSFRNGGDPVEDHDGIRIYRVPDTGHRFGRAGYVLNMHVRSLGAAALALTDVIDGSDVIESFIPLPRTRALERKGLRLVAFFAHRDKPAHWADYLHQPRHFRMEREYFRRVDTIIVASSESRRVLMDEYGVARSRIRVVPLGVPPRFLGAPPPSRGERGGDPPRLLYVGPLIRRKGLRTLMKALPIVREAGLDFRLVMAGRGPERDVLGAMAKENGYGERVEFPGFVAEDDLVSLYHGADLFVFPSLKEGFGLVLVEAMACGLPVVASAAPPIPEVVGEAALLFKPESAEDLAAALIRILSDAALRRQLAEAGARRARERYDWMKIASRTLEIYSEAA